MGHTCEIQEGCASTLCHQLTNPTTPPPRTEDMLGQAIHSHHSNSVAGRDLLMDWERVHAAPRGSVLPLQACSLTTRRSLQGRGGASGSLGQPQNGHSKKFGEGRQKLTKKIPNILATPPGWVAPAIAMHNRHSPPILRHTTQNRRVVRNLLHAVDVADTRHGAHHLTSLDDCRSDINGPDQEQLSLRTPVQRGG